MNPVSKRELLIDNMMTNKMTKPQYILMGNQTRDTIVFQIITNLFFLNAIIKELLKRLFRQMPRFNH